MSRRVTILALCTLVSLVGPSLSPGADNVPDTATRINALIHDDDVAQLLAYIRSENINLNAPYWQGITLLSQAANEDRPHIAEALLANGADVNASDDPNGKMWGPSTALAHTGFSDSRAVAELLLAKGAKVDGLPGARATPLDIAAQRGSERVALLLLEHGANPDVVDIAGWTPLHTTAYYNKPAITRILLEHGATIESVGVRNGNRTPLAEALLYARPEITDQLLTHHARCDATDFEGATTLILALEAKWETPDQQLSILKRLVQCGVDVNTEYVVQNVRPPPKNSALRVALKMGNAPAAAWLLSAGAHLATPLANGETDLHFAAASIHDASIIESLIAQGAPVDGRAWQGATPFLTAVRSGNRAAIEVLLAHGVDANEVDSMGSNALHMLAEHTPESGDTLPEYLMGHGLSANLQNKLGQTPLHLAVQLERPAMVKAILEHNPDFTLVDREGHTALDIAISKGGYEIAGMLADKGATLGKSSGAQSTALYDAIVKQDVTAVRFLLRVHADVNAEAGMEAGFRQTPLQRAARTGNVEIVKLLLNGGANLEASDRRGRTSLHLAALAGQQAVVEVLLSSGAKPAVQDEEGLTAIYYARTPEIRDLLIAHGAVAPFRTTEAQEKEACQTVLTRANTGTLGGFLGAAIPEEDLKGSPLTNWDAEELESLDARLAFQLKGADYIAGMGNGQLLYLAKRSAESVQQMICKFEVEAPAQEITASKDAELCKAVQGDSVHYVDYTTESSIADEDTRDPFVSVGKSTQLDLDNTGKPKSIAEAEYISTHGAGCDNTYPVFLSADGSHVDAERSAVIEKLVPECGTKIKPFTFNGGTYLDVSPSVTALGVERTIVKLQKGSVNQMCSLHRHSRYSIDAPLEVSR